MKEAVDCIIRSLFLRPCTWNVFMVIKPQISERLLKLPYFCVAVWYSGLFNLYFRVVFC